MQRGEGEAVTSPAPAARFFDAIARRYDRVYARERDESRASQERLLAALAPRSHVLDLGVGTGRELPLLLDGGHTVVGLDISAEMLALASRRSRPIELVQADLWAPLPFGDASFDAVIALHGTLAHPETDEARRAFPREVERVLRPGGVFFAELPTKEWLSRAPGVVRGEPGRGTFTDEATGVEVAMWLASPEEWARWLAPMETSIEVTTDGELQLVARKLRARRPSPE
jgi:SAM-dependent methyltransferase